MFLSKLPTLLSLSLLTLVAATTTGCLEHPIKPVEYERVIVDVETVQIEVNREVDVLFVIDNSGSMAEEQALLAANFQAFVGQLDAVDANYRIGIVTTDNGNPRDPKAVFEGGDLRMSSCLDRLSPDGVSGGDFIFGDFNAEFACSDHCGLTNADLELRPSAGGPESDELVPRAWLEKLDGATNLPEAVTVADAFQCFGPQGINGAGFEAPLESMYKALNKAESADSVNAGFLRDDAHLAVIFITDEVDCSFNPDFTEIFRDNTTFWSDPESPIPTSAVCWNAGTKCEGPGPVYEGCEPADYDVDGGPAATADDAVLLPMERYAGLLATIQERKAADRKVMVAAIAGVPVGFGDGAAIPYAQSEDPVDQEEFGIGAGCSFNLDDGDPSNDSLARPPVRLRELASSFPIDSEGGAGLYSICQDDYSGALLDIGEQIKARLKPACLTSCVMDTDRETELLEPSCTVTQDAGGNSENLVECEVEAGAWLVPTGATACYALLVDDSGLTDDPLDDMTIDAETGEYSCAASGNVELKIIRSAPPPSGAAISVACELESSKETYCPNLVG